MATPKTKLDMIRARVEVEYEGEDGTRYEMAFDVTPANPSTAMYLGVEPHYEGLGLWDTVKPTVIDYDLDLQFEKVLYEGLVRTISPEPD